MPSHCDAVSNHLDIFLADYNYAAKDQLNSGRRHRYWYRVELCYSKCGPWTSGITWELVKNATSAAISDQLNDNLHFNDIQWLIPIHSGMETGVESVQYRKDEHWVTKEVNWRRGRWHMGFSIWSLCQDSASPIFRPTAQRRNTGPSSIWWDQARKQFQLWMRSPDA